MISRNTLSESTFCSKTTGTLDIACNGPEIKLKNTIKNIKVLVL